VGKKKPYWSKITEKLKALAEDEDLQALSKGITDEDREADLFLIGDEIAREIASGGSLSSVAQAFRDANLNPTSPFEWLNVLKAFTDTHYVNAKGGRLKHTKEKKQALFDDLRAELADERAVTMLQACRNLMNRSDKKYSGSTALYWYNVAKDVGITRKFLESNTPPWSEED
jgi:hypothetical protein